MRNDRREKNVQTTSPAPTASAIGPCPTIIQISRTPRHWKFTQHQRSTRPPQTNLRTHGHRPVTFQTLLVPLLIFLMPCLRHWVLVLKAPPSPPLFFETGTLDFTARFTWSDSQKPDALMSRFKPLKSWEVSLRGIGKKSRKAPDFVFDESLYPCLRYSPFLDGVFCASCTVFSSMENILVTRPFTRLEQR